jgi:GT2 family glycosyltransferase
MNTFPTVMILILNWNRKEDTLACLDSVRKINYPALKVCVIDNDSTDGSSEAIQVNYPEYEQLQLDQNHGYAVGNNYGAAYALEQGVDYIYILNNDTVVDPECIRILVSTAESSEKIGAVGPIMYYYTEKNRIWSAGGALDWKKGTCKNIGLNEIDEGQYIGQRSVDYIAGTAMMVKRAVWEKVGAFDKRFFMYWEETDWCTRARAAGYELIIEESAKIWHKISPTQQATSPFIIYYMVRNNLLLLSKSRHGVEFLIPWFFVMKGVLVTALRLFTNGEKAQARAYLIGAWHFYRARFGEQKSAYKKS